jgi:hypothetical protein
VKFAVLARTQSARFDGSAPIVSAPAVQRRAAQSQDTVMLHRTRRLATQGRVIAICCASATVVGASTKTGSAGASEEPVPPESPVTTELVNGGTLIGYGITLGGGLAANFGASLNQTVPTFVPYVAIFPFAWGIHGDASKAYCTGRFIRGSRDAAKDYADAVAEHRTEKTLGREKVSDDEVLATTGWDKSLDGSCGVFTWLGVYVGKPSGFKANSTLSGNEQARDFTSYVSVGLISSPVAYFSAFAGVTFWSVEDTDAKLNRNATTFTLGLGTNLDVLSQFFK